MAKKDQSVAPKERVNITYKAKVGDSTEERELPLKILAVGDYSGKPDERQLEDRDPINIDKDNFNAVMAEQKLQTEVSVPNRLTGDGDLGVSLKFESLKDFTPADSRASRLVGDARGAGRGAWAPGRFPEVQARCGGDPQGPGESFPLAGGAQGR